MNLIYSLLNYIDCFRLRETLRKLDDRGLNDNLIPSSMPRSDMDDSEDFNDNINNSKESSESFDDEIDLKKVAQGSY